MGAMEPAGRDPGRAFGAPAVGPVTLCSQKKSSPFRNRVRQRHHGTGRNDDFIAPGAWCGEEGHSETRFQPESWIDPGADLAHDAGAFKSALFAALSAEITGRFTGMLALAGPELLETPVRLELVRRVIALDPVIDEANFRRECFRAPCQPPVLQEPVHVQVDMELAVLSANGLHRREIGRSVRRPIRNSVRHGE